MKRPFEGNPLSFRDYSKGEFRCSSQGDPGGCDLEYRHVDEHACLRKAGFAISYGLGQGATLMAALWGVFIWKEFKGASNL